MGSVAEGRWDEAGLRLAEHGLGEPAGYFLWCWENPLPERPVERVEFVPRGPRFIVAGVTTSDVDEHPFVRSPARPVRLVAQDGRGGVLDVDVDRGVATYPQPLPGDDDRAGRDYVRHTAVRRSDQLTTHHHGEADHLAWLERPFAEALRALDERGSRCGNSDGPPSR